MQCRNHFPFFVGRIDRQPNPRLIVDGSVMVDPKVATAFNETHVAQMIGYLNITELELALLINFKNARLEWKRVVQRQKWDESDAPDFRS